MSRPDEAPTQASRWEWLTAALGVALIALLFAPWYQLSLEHYPLPAVGDVAPGGFSIYVYDNLSSWAHSVVTSIVVALFGVAAVAQALVLRTTRSSGAALAWNVAMNWAAAVVSVWILVRLLFPPKGLDPGWAGWASLVVALVMLATGWLGMRDERTADAAPPDVPLRPIPPPPAA